MTGVLESSAIAVAHANIALVKYWGKASESYNLPAAGSFSASLAGLFTTTYIQFDPSLTSDHVTLNDKVATGRVLQRMSHHLDVMRRAAGVTTYAKIDSHNNFPTAAGLASSASGFAALTMAADAALGLHLSKKSLSCYARLGSGSAARSLYGGYVEMVTDETAYKSITCDTPLTDIDDLTQSPFFDASYAVPAFEASQFPLCCTIVLTAEGEKKVPSTDGMLATMATSPYYDAWLKTVPDAVVQAKKAIQIKDFHMLAEVAEASCLQMHASAMGAMPGVIYWNGATLELIHLVRQLRHDGLEVFFTIDAGPHVKIFSTPKDQYPLVKAIRTLDCVKRFIPTAVGGEPRVIVFDSDGNPLG